MASEEEMNKECKYYADPLEINFKLGNDWWIYLIKFNFIYENNFNLLNF